MFSKYNNAEEKRQPKDNTNTKEKAVIEPGKNAKPRNYGRFTKDFCSVIAHTQSANGIIEENKNGPFHYWTYSEKIDGKNYTITSFSNKLTTGLNGEQLLLLAYYNCLIYHQVKNLSAKIEDLHGMDAVRAFYGRTLVTLDVKKYAEMNGKQFKEVNRKIRENLKVLEDRVYHYFQSQKDEDGKTHFFEHEMQVLKIHEEVNENGKRKKYGLIQIEVPSNYLFAICESSPLKSFYYEVPDSLFKIFPKNLTAVKLALTALERYNQDHGTSGEGFWKLKTALNSSGLKATRTSKEGVEKSRLNQNLNLFAKAINECILKGFFEEEWTYFRIGKEIVTLTELDKLLKYCKENKTKDVYFNFQIKGVKDAMFKQLEALEPNSEKKNKTQKIETWNFANYEDSESTNLI